MRLEEALTRTRTEAAVQPLLHAGIAWMNGGAEAGSPATYGDKLPPKLLLQLYSAALAHNPAAVDSHLLRSKKIVPSCNSHSPPRKTRPGFSSVRTPALITGFPLTSTCAIPVA